MEAARERSSAPGTPSSTGGREGGGDISKLDGQSKNQNKEFHRSGGEDDYKDDMCRLLLGNSNTYLASKQQLHPPLVASRFKTYISSNAVVHLLEIFLQVHVFLRLRLLPHSIHPRTVSFHFEEKTKSIAFKYGWAPNTFTFDNDFTKRALNYNAKDCSLQMRHLTRYKSRFAWGSSCTAVPTEAKLPPTQHLRATNLTQGIEKLIGV